MFTFPHDPIRNLAELAVLIPAWQPEERLIGLVESLAAAGFGALVIVDDGSDAATGHYFQAAAALAGVHLLRHAENRGKGRALKTGMEYLLAELPHISGVVTADADGQHTVPDILRVAEALLTADGRVVMGARTFGHDVPLRSRFGNLLTIRLFGFVTGAHLVDTQTGLRAFPRHLLPELLPLEGERYEYEMTVLAYLCRNGRKPLQLPIETVYLDDNCSSHFNPIWDSMRIYRALARFYF